MRRLVALAALLFQVSHSEIRSCGNTSGYYGEDTKLQCALNGVQGVQQVIWQLTLPNKMQQDVASYNEKYGKMVNKEFQHKVIFSEASLSAPSITVKNLTWSDESCYVCWFNTFPDGSVKCQICLSVKGISDVQTGSHAIAVAQSTMVFFTCSATGRPAPHIEWEVSPDKGPAGEPQNTTQTNGDRTWTSVSNITLDLPLDWTGHVVCVVNRGEKDEQRKRIPLPVLDSHREQNDAEEKDNQGERHRVGIILAAAILATVAVAGAVQIWRRGHSRGDVKREKTNAV
ncbi:OX-2 membrane glycoprotein-like [Synchiropus splendidus]|uniref:OX-2 membrane glycoprotein-like n=1 Tax=Synchiropus splendidus TaxID=270530 RepID=UPI00237D8E0D|nr:OX-2 membrane glycoprotein-like [Synchiropus splendidus]